MKSCFTEDSPEVMTEFGWTNRGSIVLISHQHIPQVQGKQRAKCTTTCTQVAFSDRSHQKTTIFTSTLHIKLSFSVNSSVRRGSLNGRPRVKKQQQHHHLRGTGSCCKLGLLFISPHHCWNHMQEDAALPELRRMTKAGTARAPKEQSTPSSLPGSRQKQRSNPQFHAQSCLTAPLQHPLPSPRSPWMALLSLPDQPESPAEGADLSGAVCTEWGEGLVRMVEGEAARRGKTTWDTKKVGRANGDEKNGPIKKRDQRWRKLIWRVDYSWYLKWKRWSSLLTRNKLNDVRKKESKCVQTTRLPRMQQIQRR